MTFAQLYDDTPHGQLLVMLEWDKTNRPQVRLYFCPEGFGYSYMAITYQDTDAGRAAAELDVAQMTRERAIEWAANIFAAFAPMVEIREGGPA